MEETHQSVNNVNFQDLKSSSQPLKSLNTHMSFKLVLKETKEASKAAKKIHHNMKHVSPQDTQCSVLGIKTQLSGFKP